MCYNKVHPSSIQGDLKFSHLSQEQDELVEWNQKKKRDDSGSRGVDLSWQPNNENEEG